MRAITIDRFGGPDVLVLSEVPEPPPPGPGEVVVAIHAAGVNPLDAAVRSGRLAPLLGRDFPLIVGNDGAGTVTAIGAGVSNVGIGERVHGLFDAAPTPSRHGFATPGTYAELAVTRASTLARVPDDVDMVMAGAIPVAGLTAYQTLVRKARIERRSSVLVIGASGGVGTFATQIAIALGAKVTGVAGGSRTELVRSLGAHTVIDHQEVDLTTLNDRFDLVYDVSTRFSFRCLRHLVAPGGLFVANIGPRLAMLSPNLRRPERRFGRYGFAWVTSDAHDLTALTAMVEAGQIRPCIEEVLPLADAATAHRILESGRVFGKVVLDVRR
ncbi:MAG: NADP-dependent oxidoreductase [Acidimicrobiales bacterium]|nr:NADP-dependent oxidoreductase [Acidimicrobiales bacterium]MCB9376931.1 NADP-dependent oxidoreductase [Microthrixaceae bacterium]HNI34119.1 NADP-dependent oxidoreductase [Microthrixaceae bacterium]